jgi:uncharacterized membrane protein
MGDYEASTTVQVPADRLFAYLSDVESLPDYLPQMTGAHRKADGKVDVEAVIHPDGEPERTVSGEAWVEVVEDGRKLRWERIRPARLPRRAGHRRCRWRQLDPDRATAHRSCRGRPDRRGSGAHAGGYQSRRGGVTLTPRSAT